MIGNPGPGSANLLAGVITARHEGVPMLAITSQHRLGIVYPSSPSTFQGQDQLDVYRRGRQVGRTDLRRGTRIPEVVQLAFREMWTGPTGTGADRAAGAGPLRDRRRVAACACRRPRRTARRCRRRPRRRSRRSPTLLAAPARPLVIAGSGVDRAGANAALLAARRTARLPGRPVDGRPRRRAARPSRTRLRSRRRGRPREARGRRRAGRGIAARQPRSARTTSTGAIPRAARRADRHRPAHIGVTRPLALGIVADARAALEGLAGRARRAGRRAEGPGVPRAGARSGGRVAARSRCSVVDGLDGPGPASRRT